MAAFLFFCNMGLNKQHLFFLSIAILLCFFSCKKKGHVITVIPLTSYHDTIYLERINFEQPVTVIDSAVVLDNNQSTVNWQLPTGYDHIYQVRSKAFRRNNFIFVGDTDAVIRPNFVAGNYKVEGSKGSALLIKFNDTHVRLAQKTRDIAAKIDSLKKTGADAKTIATLNDTFKKALYYYFDYAVNFADTVRSPAVFMVAFYTIDFGPQYEKLKKFIVRAGKRFPNYAPVQQLAKDELAIVKIYQEEYNIGDKLPGITLPDYNGFNVNTADYTGKYYLIDFWSSWCTQCMPFKEAEKALLEKIPGKINVISVAIDNQKTECQQVIQSKNYHWTQLIDADMWKGAAVRTLKFDSIPFNFLVAPNGKIVAKALNAQNLQKAVLNNLK